MLSNVWDSFVIWEAATSKPPTPVNADEHLINGFCLFFVFVGRRRTTTITHVTRHIHIVERAAASLTAQLKGTVLNNSDDRQDDRRFAGNGGI